MQNLLVFHGDFNSNNIYITENGVIKISDNGIYKRLNTTYEKIKRGEYNCLPAPEVLAFIHSKISPQELNPFKSDVFSIGMVLLEAGTLLSSNDCYFYDKLMLIDMEIKLRLEIFSGRYSQILTETIRKLIQYEPINRPDFEYLMKNLEPYYQDIINVKNVNFFFILWFLII